MVRVNATYILYIHISLRDEENIRFVPFTSVDAIFECVPHTRPCARRTYLCSYTAAAAAWRPAMLFIHNTSLNLTEIDTAMHKHNI